MLATIFLCLWGEGYQDKGNEGVGQGLVGGVGQGKGDRKDSTYTQNLTRNTTIGRYKTLLASQLRRKGLPSHLFRNGGCILFLMDLIPSCLRVQVEVQDTVGCGDSFAAAIVLGYIRSHDIPATLVLANAVGAATAMGRGAGTNVASAPTVSY